MSYGGQRAINFNYKNIIVLYNAGRCFAVKGRLSLAESYEDILYVSLKIIMISLITAIYVYVRICIRQKRKLLFLIQTLLYSLYSNLILITTLFILWKKISQNRTCYIFDWIE